MVNLPTEIQDVLNQVIEDFETAYYTTIDNRDRTLTETLICEDCYDFVVVDNLGCIWVFAYNEQTDTWEAFPTSAPRFEIDRAMIGDDSINFEEFTNEIAHQLGGVEVVARSEENGANNNTPFCDQFQNELEDIFQKVLQEVAE